MALNINLYPKPRIVEAVQPGHIIEALSGSKATDMHGTGRIFARTTGVFGYVHGPVAETYSDPVHDWDSFNIDPGYIAVKNIDRVPGSHSIRPLENWLDGDGKFRALFEHERAYFGPLIVLGQVTGNKRCQQNWLTKNGMSLNDEERELLRRRMLEYDVSRPRNLVVETPGGIFDFSQVKFVSK